ncbi:MAG: RNA polymerase sigma factor SigJ, partial [Alphaproteobacteria bacterium]
RAMNGTMAADVSLHADGGGKRPAVPRPVIGYDAVMKLHESLMVFFRKNHSELVRICFINGLPGFITRESDGELQTTALDIENEKITAIYVMRNPDKMRHLH